MEIRIEATQALLVIIIPVLFPWLHKESSVIKSKSYGQLEDRQKSGDQNDGRRAGLLPSVPLP